jgi:hypothetical protein
MVLYYHCFDRIVINGHLLGLMRECQIVYFFRNVCGHPKLTKELLRRRSQDYRNWVEHFARNHKIPLIWRPPKVRQEEVVAARQQRCLQAGKFGVYYILRSREQGWTFRIVPPKFPSADPNYQIVHKHRSLYTHYYFYIVDPIAGPMALRVGSFLPFSVTAYLNGHNFIERQLTRQHVKFVKEDNRFVSVADPAKLQAAANRLDGKTLQRRIDYWTFIVAPKFSAKERAAWPLILRQVHLPAPRTAFCFDDNLLAAGSVALQIVASGEARRRHTEHLRLLAGQLVVCSITPSLPSRSRNDPQRRDGVRRISALLMPLPSPRKNPRHRR